MTPRWVWVSLGAVLAAIVALIFVYPHQLVSPGDLKPSHASLQQDCFACHAAFRGATSERCVACHVVADIGRLTTKGARIDSRSARAPFHQDLTTQDCMACHTDHPRPRLTHSFDRAFDHALLKPETRGRCANCHRAPADELHRSVDRRCAQCHSTKAWKPAAFDHVRYFSLASPHDTTCSTCHVGGNLKAFTCYGCHEHQKARTEAEHREEGIRDIDNCVRCHRNADDEPGEDGRGEWEGRLEDREARRRD